MKTDEELIKQFQSGNDDSFNELVKRHLPGTYGFFIKFTSDPIEAEDLAQDVFIKMYKALKKFRFQSTLKGVNGEIYYTWTKLLSQSILIIQMKINGDVMNYGMRYLSCHQGKGLL